MKAGARELDQDADAANRIVFCRRRGRICGAGLGRKNHRFRLTGSAFDVAKMHMKRQQYELSGQRNQRQMQSNSYVTAKPTHERTRYWLSFGRGAAAVKRSED